MAKQLEKVYDPKQVEDRTYQFWLDKNYFHADAESKKEPYTIVIPPPNITGQLHMGHALDNTLQDALIRWRRMQGYEALWLPGTDHASIATEAKIVEAMRKMEQMEDIVRRLPGYDCGSCGSPTCRTFAEDIVRGYCNEMDCIHILKEQLKVMAQKMVELAKTTRE